MSDSALSIFQTTSQKKLYFRIKTLLLEVIVPCMVFLFISNILFASDYLTEKMISHRKQKVDRNTIVQWQMMRIEKMATEKSQYGKVIFVGSSSVVNGIDVNIVDDVLKSSGLNEMSRNYGATGLSAYELPLLKRYLLRPDVRLIVFLYNTFSFGDHFHEQAYLTRWDTFEFIKLGFYNHSDGNLLTQVSNGMGSELLHIVRYKALIRQYLRGAIDGDLKLITSYYDYPADEPLPPENRDIKLLRKRPDREFVRLMVKDSITGKDTIGHAGMLRFIQLAKQKNIRVIVAPAPEPKYADYAFREGLNIDRYDNKIEELVLSAGAEYLPRSYIREFESKDVHFRDIIHLHSTARKIYSKIIAKRVVKYLAGSNNGV